MKKSLFLLLVSVLLFSCARSIDPLQDIATPQPTVDNAKASGIPCPTLQKGHGVYMRHCAQCHEHRLPTSAELPAFHQTIATMSDLSGISATEEAALHEYLDQFTDR